MSNFSYEKRVAILLGVCVTSAVVLFVIFFLIQKDKLSGNSLQVQTPSIDLSVWKDAMDSLQAQQEQTQSQEPSSTTSEQESTQPADDVSLKQTPQE